MTNTKSLLDKICLTKFVTKVYALNINKSSLIYSLKCGFIGVSQNIT